MLTAVLGRSAVLIPQKLAHAQILHYRTVQFSFRLVMKPNKATKQADISNFFSSKPREPSQKVPLTQPKASKIASPARNTQLRGPASSASPSNRTNLVPSNPQPAKLKRLRKATEAAAAKPSEQAANGVAAPSGTAATGGVGGQEVIPALAPAVVAAAVQHALLEDADGSSQPAGKRAKMSPATSPRPLQPPAAKRKRNPSAEENDSDVSEAEEAAPEPTPRKKAVLKYKAPTKRVEGVGTGSLAAAALHADFDLEKLAPWKEGSPVPFAFLAAAFEAIGSDSKRLAKTQQLVNVFWAILGRTPQDLLPAVYLCTNQVAPSHEGTELGIGDAILIKALAQATGRQDAKIKQEYQECGDLGTVASAARGMQRTMFKPQPLTLRGVFGTFLEIAKTEGQKSQDRKRALITKLLVSSQDNEPGYIMRALQGKLRIGLGAETVLVSLAHAVLLHKQGGSTGGGDLANKLEEAAQAVKLAYSQCPSYDKLVPALLEHPVEEIHRHVHFLAGVPIKPMLAKPTTGVSEVLDKFQDIEFTCEFKYDGERAQIHIAEGGKVSIYSRNSENNTGKYPDLAAMLPRLLKDGVTSAVLDAEAVAFDRGTGKILPFQVLSTRARKDVKVEDIKVRVCIFAFDCLYLNSETLLQKPLTDRRAALQSAVDEKPGELQFATAKTSTDLEELAQFLEESVAAGTEGLIVKTLDSTYEPSRRSAHWLKLKKDYLEGVGDTFDVVVIGAWHGRGKRKGVYGSYLLAIYNEESEQYETISKIGTGFSDEVLTELSTQLHGCIIPGPKPYYKYGETLVPEVWFDTKYVWEVKAADLSISPVHRAGQGLVDPAKGISIRFPRLVRVRDDKDPEQATTAEQVAEMFRAQALQADKKKGAQAVDDDY